MDWQVSWEERREIVDDVQKKIKIKGKNKAKAWLRNIITEKENSNMALKY